MIVHEQVKAVMRAENLTRTYKLEQVDVHALKGVTLEIAPGEMTAIIGRSGSGKTTMMNLLAGLDHPTSGEVWFKDQAINHLSEPDLLRLRQAHFGFVFQAFGLLPLLSAAENIGVPLRMRHMGRSDRDQRVMDALDWVGLTKRAKHRPYELSGGEQQRVAIARALVAQPDVIFADEPTGQLDSATRDKIISLLRRTVIERKVTVVIVTHDPQVMREADRVFELRDGALLDQQRSR